ncbi:MAG: hypothetical protein K8S54_16605 [Spirochaetia bacterium]|nr:hypothetical protein [Spirochaetia bacterium]
MNRSVIFSRISWYAGCTAVVTFPISISLSQMSLAFAILAWIGDRLTAKQLPGPTAEPVLLAACGIFAAQILSLALHAAQSSAPGTFIRLGFERETKDLMLLSMAFWVFAVTAEERSQVSS